MRANGGAEPSILNRIANWPVLREVADLGMGPQAVSEHSKRWQARILDADKKHVEMLRQELAKHIKGKKFD